MAAATGSGKLATKREILWVDADNKCDTRPVFGAVCMAACSAISHLPSWVALHQQQPALNCASTPRSAHLSWCSLSFGGSSCGAGVLLAEVAPSSARTCLATASTLCILLPSCSAPCKARVLPHVWKTPPLQKSAQTKSSLRHLVPMSLVPQSSQVPPRRARGKRQAVDRGTEGKGDF